MPKSPQHSAVTPRLQTAGRGDTPMLNESMHELVTYSLVNSQTLEHNVFDVDSGRAQFGAVSMSPMNATVKALHKKRLVNLLKPAEFSLIL
jgi:hypothetical protein